MEIEAEKTTVRPIYDLPQLHHFFDHVADDRLAALWRLYGSWGLRRGEALALRWSAVNLAAGTIHVRESLGVVDGHLVFGPTKTGSKGDRAFVVDEEMVAQLRAHQVRQKEERLRCAEYDDRDLVFAREGGGPLRPEYVSKRFRALARGAGLPVIPLHSLRHSSATLLLRSGVPMRVVSEVLGHSTMRVTSDTYSHVVDDLKIDAARRVGEALGKTVSA